MSAHRHTLTCTHQEKMDESLSFANFVLSGIIYSSTWFSSLFFTLSRDILHPTTARGGGGTLGLYWTVCIVCLDYNVYIVWNHGQFICIVLFLGCCPVDMSNKKAVVDCVPARPPARVPGIWPRRVLPAARGGRGPGTRRTRRTERGAAIHHQQAWTHAGPFGRTSTRSGRTRDKQVYPFYFQRFFLKGILKYKIWKIFSLTVLKLDL